MNKQNFTYIKELGVEVIDQESFDSVTVAITYIEDEDRYLLLSLKSGKLCKQYLYRGMLAGRENYEKLVQIERTKFETIFLPNDSLDVLRAKMDKKASSMGLCGIFAFAKVLNRPVYDVFMEAKGFLGKRGNWKGSLKTSDIDQLKIHFNLVGNVIDVVQWCKTKNKTLPPLKMFLPSLKEQGSGDEKIMIILTGHAMFFDGEKLYDQNGVYDSVYTCRFKNTKVQRVYRF